MAASTIAIPLFNVTRRLTLKVKITGARTFPFRCWLAGLFFELGASIVGMNVEVDVVETPEA